jgi:regulatory protein
VDAYTQALAWLARRELSAAQVRTRLARRGENDAAIEDAITRLTRERALDDRRVATAYARSAVTLKARGRTRIHHDIEALGIDRDLARAAVDDVFSEIDETALLETALTRRWPPVGAPDQRTLRRIYQALVQQGFSADKVMAALRARHSGFMEQRFMEQGIDE